MAESNVKITFEIDGLEQSVTSIDDAKKALKGLEDQAKKAEKGMESVGDAAEDAADKAKGGAEATEGFFKVADEATGGLATKVKEVTGGLVKMVKQGYSGLLKLAKGSKMWATALAMTGIGAILIAVNLLVSYWDDIKGLVNGVSGAQKRLLEDTQATVDANQANLEATEASENSLKLAGKSEKEIRDLKIQQTNEVITATEALLEQQKAMKKSQVEAAQRNQKILAGIIGFISAPVTILLGAIDALTYGLTQVGVLDKATTLAKDFTMGTAKLIFDPEEVAAEGDATIAETQKQLNSLKNKRDGYLLQNKEADKTAKKDAVDNQKELNAELERLRAENLKDAEEKALKLLEIEYNKQKAELAAKGASDDLLLELEKKYQTDRNAIIADFAQQRKDEADALKKQEDEEKATRDDILNNLALSEIEQEFARKKKELEIARDADRQKLVDAHATTDQLKAFDDAYLAEFKKLKDEEADYNKKIKQEEAEAALNATTSALDSISDLAAEGSAVGKAAAVASATINTFQAATNALANTPAPPPFPQIAAAAAIAAGLANIRKIMEVKTPGGKEKGAKVPTINIPGGSAFDPSTINAGAQGVQNQLTLGQQQGSTGATIVKAYVVSSDMTTQQEKDKKINELARL